MRPCFECGRYSPHCPAFPLRRLLREPAVDCYPCRSDRLRSYNITPEEVVTAVGKGNANYPSGNVRFGDMMPMVPVNSVVSDVKAVGRRAHSLRWAPHDLIHDIGTVEDSADTQTGYAIVNWAAHRLYSGNQASRCFDFERGRPRQGEPP